MNKVQRLFAITVGVIVLGTVGLSWSGAQEAGLPETQVAPVTDSVDFGAELRADEKTPEVLTRYAATHVGDQIWSTSTLGGTQSTVHGDSYTVNGADIGYSSDVCVHGGETGGAGECWTGGQVAGASSDNGQYSFFVNASLLGLTLDNPYMGAMIEDQSLSTGAQCYLDEDGTPRSKADRPAGSILYGGGHTLGLITDSNLMDIAGIENGVTAEDVKQVDALLGWSRAHLRVTPRWEVATEGNQAVSEVRIEVRVTTSGLLGIGAYNSGWQSLTVRSECGFTTEGSEALRAFAGAAETPPQSVRSPREGPLASAVGRPQATGFSAEGTLDLRDMSYHLLATRELDALDHLFVEEVLEDISATGDVEGSNWKLFSAEVTGEQVPVVEIELADGAVVQVRPTVPGVVLPSPDVMEIPRESEVPSIPMATTPEPTTAFEEPTTTKSEPSDE